jgi:hypothetical protein
LSTEKSTKDPTLTTSGQRRSKRYALRIPIQVKWSVPGQETRVVNAQVKEVNVQGALLQFLDTDSHPPNDAELELMNLFSDKKAAARVSGIRRSPKGMVLGVAIELLNPDENFWGMTFRLKRTTDELFALEQAIKSGDIDPRVLRDFRDAIDYVRKTAWAVQEWQERQVQHRDTATVLPLLITERIRRATQLCNVVSMDMKEHEVAPDTAGVENLYRVIHNLYRELKIMFDGA